MIIDELNMLSTHHELSTILGEGLMWCNGKEIEGERGQVTEEHGLI